MAGDTPGAVVHPNEAMVDAEITIESPDESKEEKKPDVKPTSLGKLFQYVAESRAAAEESRRLLLSCHSNA